MLSTQFIRENTERVKRDIEARHTTAPIDRILELDEAWRSLLQEVEQLRAERNAASKAIGLTKDAAERNAKIAATREAGDRIDRRALALVHQDPVVFVLIGDRIAAVEMAEPASGWTAFFVELTYPGGGGPPLKLTTAVRIVPDTTERDSSP